MLTTTNVFIGLLVLIGVLCIVNHFLDRRGKKPAQSVVACDDARAQAEAKARAARLAGDPYWASYYALSDPRHLTAREIRSVRIQRRRASLHSRRALLHFGL